MGYFDDLKVQSNAPSRSGGYFDDLKTPAVTSKRKGYFDDLKSSAVAEKKAPLWKQGWDWLGNNWWREPVKKIGEVLGDQKKTYGADDSWEVDKDYIPAEDEEVYTGITGRRFARKKKQWQNKPGLTSLVTGERGTHTGFRFPDDLEEAIKGRPEERESITDPAKRLGELGMAGLDLRYPLSFGIMRAYEKHVGHPLSEFAKKQIEDAEEENNPLVREFMKYNAANQQIGVAAAGFLIPLIVAPSEELRTFGKMVKGVKGVKGAIQGFKAAPGEIGSIGEAFGQGLGEVGEAGTVGRGLAKEFAAESMPAARKSAEEVARWRNLQQTGREPVNFVMSSGAARREAGLPETLADLKGRMAQKKALAETPPLSVKDLGKQVEELTAKKVAISPSVKTAGEPWERTSADIDSMYALAGDTVSGNKVGKHIKNLSSVDASVENSTELKGIREIPMSVFQDKGLPSFYSTTEKAATEKLSQKIKQSGIIDPLIIVEDGGNGPYILEGGHRFDALKMLGKESFPAMVVVDENAYYNTVKSAVASGKPVPSEVLAEYPELASKVAPAGIPPVVPPKPATTGLLKEELDNIMAGKSVVDVPESEALQAIRKNQGLLDKAKQYFAKVFGSESYKEIKGKFKDVEDIVRGAARVKGTKMGIEINKVIGEFIEDPGLAWKVRKGIRGELAAEEMTPGIRKIIDSPEVSAALAEFDNLGEELVRLGMLEEGRFLNWKGKYTSSKYLPVKDPAAKAVMKGLKEGPAYEKESDVVRLMEERITKLPKNERELLEMHKDLAGGIARGVEQESVLSAVGKIAEEVAENPKYAEFVSNTFVEGKNLMRVPEDPSLYGKLAGKFLDKDIFKQMERAIFGIGDPNIRALLSNPIMKWYIQNIHRPWKRAKTIWNPFAFNIRNLEAGVAQAGGIGGMPYPEILNPVKAARNLKELASTAKGGEVPPLLRQALDLDVLSGVGVDELASSYKAIPKVAQKSVSIKTWLTEDKPIMEKFNEVRESIGKGHMSITQGAEAFMRYSYFRWLMTTSAERGTPIAGEMAKKITDHVFINYANVSDVVKLLRDLPMGAPFVSFFSEMIPKFGQSLVGYSKYAGELAKAGMKVVRIPGTKIDIVPKLAAQAWATMPAIAAKAAKVIAIPTGGWLARETLKRASGKSEEQWSEEESQRPDFQQGLGNLYLGKKDGKGYDIETSYSISYGDVLDMVDDKNLTPEEKRTWMDMIPAGARPGGEALIILSALLNYDTFTKKPIYDRKTPGIGSQIQKTADFLYKGLGSTWLPPIPGVSEGGMATTKMVNALTGKPSRTGKKSNLLLTFADVVLALKIKEFDPAEVRDQKVKYIKNLINSYKSVRTMNEKDQSKSEGQKQKNRNEIEKRILQLEEELYR